MHACMHACIVQIFSFRLHLESRYYAKKFKWTDCDIVELPTIQTGE